MKFNKFKAFSIDHNDLSTLKGGIRNVHMAKICKCDDDLQQCPTPCKKSTRCGTGANKTGYICA